MWTFRKWNPKKVDAPWGADTSADIDDGYCNSWVCYMCKIAACCFDTLFEEVVYLINETDVDGKSMLKQSDEAVQTAGRFIRPAAIFLCMFGFYCLFAPIV